jgi:flap endonuclease-1
MGINDLLPYLRTKAPNAFCAFNAWKKSNKLRAAIDTPIFMYKFAYAVGTGKPLCSRMLRFVNELHERDIEPVFVFDGGNLPEKVSEIRRRREALQRASELRDLRTNFKCGNVDYEVEKSCPSIRPIAEDYQALKLAMDMAGIETATAKFEAEALCSHLCKQGIVDIVITEDSDALAYLCPSVLLNWKNDREEVVGISKVCEALQLNGEEFQDFCVLLGNDFNSRIKGVGPVKAMELIKKHRSLDKLIETNIHNMCLTSVLASQKLFRSTCYENS